MAFDGLFQINVKAPFFLVAALAPKIAARGGGSIINVSTMVASYGRQAWLPTAPRGRRSNCSPRRGPPNTGRRTSGSSRLLRSTLTPAVEPRLAMATEFAKTIPLGRLAAVHELSDVITFLATPAAGYINGAIIHVDGGRTAI